MPAAIEPIAQLDIPAAFYGIQHIDLTEFDGDTADANWVRLIRSLARTLKRPGLLEREAAAQGAAAGADAALKAELAELRAELAELRAAARTPDRVTPHPPPKIPVSRVSAPPAPEPAPAAPASARRAGQWVLALSALALAGLVWWLVDRSAAEQDARRSVWLEEMPAEEETPAEAATTSLADVQAVAATPEENLAAAEDYLAVNGGLFGITTTASGLQYAVMAEGPAEGVSPALGQWVCVHYRGTFIDGSEFDSSFARGQAAAFPSDGLIAGFVEALSMMKPGDTWRLSMHPDLAYGPAGGPGIPPNSALLFDVSLIKLLDGPAPDGVDCAA